jgi:hypothetical protein
MRNRIPVRAKIFNDFKDAKNTFLSYFLGFYEIVFWCAENTKTAVLVRGVKCSSLIQRCLKDLAKLKRPNAVTYNQKNDIRPFEVSFYSIPSFTCQSNTTVLLCTVSPCVKT